MIKTKKCIVCENEFQYNDSNKHGKGSKLRKKSDKTCSPKCSRVFGRIYKYFNSKRYRKCIAQSAKKK
jgi:hypothetical protein